MGHAHAVLMVLFVAGFALFAYGVTYTGAPSGQYVDFSATSANQVPEDAEVVDYGNLSGSAREAFDRAMQTNSLVALATVASEINADYVRYEEQYYQVAVVTDGPRTTTFEFSLGALGLVVSSLSTVVYLLLRRESVS